ncbi:MAG: hypothetical protein IPG00_21265 [Saprospiraceae bacterium]|nr:hypothetical protein [Saprospiraceae bacterium]
MFRHLYGQCGCGWRAAIVHYPVPTATDCGQPVSTVCEWIAIRLLLSPIGNTTVVYTATDNGNNTSTCSMVITVVDSDSPQISCPGNTINVCTG